MQFLTLWRDCDTLWAKNRPHYMSEWTVQKALSTLLFLSEPHIFPVCFLYGHVDGSFSLKRKDFIHRGHNTAQYNKKKNIFDDLRLPFMTFTWKSHLKCIFFF